MPFVVFSVQLAPWALTVYLFVAVVSGVFIGATGIGGVLLVPLLLLMDVPVGLASRAVLASFLLGGIVAAVSNHRRGSLPRLPASLLLPCVVPGALLGALLLQVVPALVISATLALLATVAGSHTLRAALAASREAAPPTSSSFSGAELTNSNSSVEAQQPGVASGERDTVSMLDRDDVVDRYAWIYGPIGGVVGLLSVLTATGGPFICVPLLFFLKPRLPSTHVVGLCTTSGIPISICATLLNSLHTEVDIGLASTIAIAVAFGIPLGVRLAHRTAPHVLKLAIGTMLLGIGVSTLWKLGAGDAGRLGEGPDPGSGAGAAAPAYR